MCFQVCAGTAEEDNAFSFVLLQVTSRKGELVRSFLLALIVATCVIVTGCSASGAGTAQSAFHHNNREHANWVKNPGKAPQFKNPNTGGKMFY